MKANLADVIARGISVPDGLRKIEYCDDGPGAVPGLLLEARATSPGRGSWMLRYKKDGRTKYVAFGSSADVTLSQVRRSAKAMRAKIVCGADPREEANARRSVLTYAEFFDDHYLPHAKLHKRSWDRDEELYRLRIKTPFGGKRLNQITRHQVQSFHADLAAEGLAAATANHHIKLLRSSLNLARQWGMLEGENPAAGVALLPEENRVENFLDDAQLQRLLEVLRTDHNQAVCKVALFLLSTGCRLNEALSATWGDVDIERRAFTIRATNSKSRKLRSVPLNDSAIAVLDSLDRGEGADPLFISSRGRKRHERRAFTTISRQWQRVRKLAGLPHLRLHDLRHSFASFLVNDGRSIYEVSKILGHSTVTVTERYAHLSTKTMQAASASASAKMNGAAAKPAT